ncbi:MAG TPA: hypothetical protein VFE52_06210, partial [Devosia sp.]|nr:hypothetical protein [Devosia sp.]
QDYNAAVGRVRKPFEMAGDERSRAAADAAYPTLEVPQAPQAGTPQMTRSIGGKTYAHDGRGWYEVR